MDNSFFTGGIAPLGANAEEQTLLKAIGTDNTIGGQNSAAVGADTWKKEFVSELITSLVATNEDIQFTNHLAIDYSPTLYYQALLKTKIGELDMFQGSNDQATINNLANPDWSRQIFPLKYMYDRKSIYLSATSEFYYGNLGNIREVLAQDALLSLLIRENKQFMYGTRNIPSMIAGVFDNHRRRGSVYLTESDYAKLEEVNDLRGTALNYDLISAAQNVLSRHYASNIKFGLFMPTVSIEGVSSKDFSATSFRMITPDQLNSKPIFDDHLAGIRTKTGKQVYFFHDIFSNRETIYGSWKISDSAQPTNASCPAVPNVSSGTNSATPDSESLFITSDNGTYFYAVSAINYAGTSKLALINAIPVTVTAGERVDLKFVSGAGANLETGYLIWRSAKNAVDATGYFQPLFTVSVSDLALGFDGAAIHNIADKNRYIPGMQDLILIPLEAGSDICDRTLIRKVEQQSMNGAMSGIKRFDLGLAVGTNNEPSYSTILAHHCTLSFPGAFKCFVFRNVKP